MQEDKSRVNDPEMQCPTYVNDLHLCQYLPPMLMVSTNPPVCSISIFSLHMIVALTLNFMVLYLYLSLYLSGKHESHKREICEITHVTSASFSSHFLLTIFLICINLYCFRMQAIHWTQDTRQATRGTKKKRNLGPSTLNAGDQMQFSAWC